MSSKSILITGCSSGIGLASALALRDRDYRVFAAARKAEDVARLQAMGFESVLLDVTDTDSIHSAVDHILACTGGTLDALFNNAGYLQAGAIQDLSTELIEAQFRTNVFGPMALIRAVLPAMKKQQRGRIIQNSSILGVMTLPYYGAYNASKFALEGFSRTLRQELKPSNIQVSLINPGPIMSQLRTTAYQHYQVTVKSDVSAYAHAYQKLEATYFNQAQDAKTRAMMASPDAVVKALVHALESRSPKIHYFVGMPAICMAVLCRVLPERVLEWLLDKISK